MRQHCKEQYMMLSIAACVVVLGSAAAVLSPLLSDIREIFVDSGLSDSYLSLIFKAAAISLITHITCELCRDCGESAIASAAEIWGKACLSLMSVPLIKSIMEQIWSSL